MYLLNCYFSLVNRYDQWDKFTKEVEELNLSVGNFTVSINLITTHYVHT
jgi:hypothetical protein